MIHAGASGWNPQHLSGAVLFGECQPNTGVVCESDHHLFVAVRNPDWMTRSAMCPRSYRRLRQYPIHQKLLPREGMHLAVVVAEEGGLVAVDPGGEVHLIEGGGAQGRWAE